MPIMRMRNYYIKSNTIIPIRTVNFLNLIHIPAHNPDKIIIKRITISYFPFMVIFVSVVNHY